MTRVLLAALLSLASYGAAHADYAGRPLAEALAGLQREGLALIFSSDLVRADMLVKAEPKGHAARDVLRELLAPHGLTTSEGPRGTLLVVRARPPAPPKAGALAIGAPSDGAAAAPLRFEDTVDVRSEPDTHASLAPSLSVKPADVMGVAGALENVFRMVQTLPGVTGVNELEGRICVQGGGPDQNLTVLDGIEVHNPYRLWGIASAFNPETVESFELLSGALHPRYGDRLSSVLVVDTRHGRRDKALAGSAALSLTDANVFLEGRLPGLHDASWWLTGRRTYYDLVLSSAVPDAQLPSFDDVQLKTSWEPRAGAQLSLLALRNHETGVFQRNKTGQFDLHSRGDLLALRYLTNIGERSSFEGVASLYRSHDAMGLADNYVGVFGDRLDPFTENILVGREVQVEDWSLRSEWTHRLSPRHRVGSGLDLHRIQTGVAWRLGSDVNGQLAIGPWMGPGGPGPLVWAAVPPRFRGGFWIDDQLQISDRLKLHGGLRLDRGGITAQTTLSPRVSARLQLGAATVMEGGIGLHTQTTGFEKFLQRDFAFDPLSMFDLTRLGPQGLRSERALQGVLSLERSLARGLDVRLEAYYRTFDDLVVGRLETDAERDARVAQYDFPPPLQAAIPRERQLTRFPTNEGKGRSYGFELLLSRRPASAESRFGGWLAYSFGRAEREAYGIRYPFDYDRRHALSLVGSYRPFAFFDLSATARVGSGLPWTPARGLRVSAAPDVDDGDHDGNRSELVPRPREYYGGFDYELDYGGLAARNSARTPVYARLDVRASFRPHGNAGHWTFYVDVINVLGRANPLLMVPAVGVNGSKVSVVDGSGGNLPRIPSLGIRWRF